MNSTMYDSLKLQLKNTAKTFVRVVMPAKDINWRESHLKYAHQPFGGCCRGLRKWHNLDVLRGFHNSNTRMLGRAPAFEQDQDGDHRGSSYKKWQARSSTAFCSYICSEFRPFGNVKYVDVLVAGGWIRSWNFEGRYWEYTEPEYAIFEKWNFCVF